MIIVCIYLPSSPPHSHIGSTAPRPPTLQQALADFDFLGTATLLVAISSLLLGLSNHTAFLYEWRDTRVWALLLISLITTAVFLLVEWKVAVNPVVPLQLFKGWRMSSIYASNFMLSVAAQSFVSSVHRLEYRTIDEYQHLVAVPNVRSMTEGRLDAVADPLSPVQSFSPSF
mgnify:CR=1 FL=1